VKLFSSLFIISGLLLLIFKRKEKHALEFYFLALSLIIGSVFLIKANNFLIIFLSIELISFTSYLLSGFSFTKESFESSIKYLLFGATSSAVTLFGIAIIYGTTSEFYISDLNSILFADLGSQVGLGLFLIGILFKASIFPMHLWVPAIYQSAPIDAVTLMSVVPKLAALVFLNRLFETLDLPVGHYVLSFVLIAGITSIVMGTFGALGQKNVRRMIAFGAIAHSGFLLALAAFNNSAFQEAFWWYSVVYIIMNYAVFYLIEQYEISRVFSIGDYEISNDYVLPIAISIVLISLVGIPPLAGFTAKLLLFTSLYDLFQTVSHPLILSYLIVAVFSTVISLFFYLRIPYQLFLVKKTQVSDIHFTNSSKIIATLFAFALLLLFFVPDLVTKIKYLLNQ